MVNILTKHTKEITKRERERERVVVWALFDDAESSCMEAIKKYYDNEFEVHSIGINTKKLPLSKKYFYHRIDLSLINFELINELTKIPYPDIITASPPCESWSGADCAGRMFRLIDNQGNWHVKNKKYYDEYLKKSHPVKRRYFLQKETSRILGEATIGATLKIIQHFKPKIWVIENPQTSKIWDYIENHWNFAGFKNLASYSAYEHSFSAKPTIFKSNIKLKLKSKKDITSNKAHMANGSYNRRSAIPYTLIKDYLQQVLDYINANKF